MHQLGELADSTAPVRHDKIYSFEATCDPHIHIDEWDEHGISPIDLAQALHKKANSHSNRLNTAVLLAHNGIDIDNFFRVEQLLADISEGVRRRVKLLFGTEVTVWFGGDKHHVVCAFDGKPNPFNYPEIPRASGILGAEEFEDFMKDRGSPFVSIAVHPGMMDKELRQNTGSLMEFLESGLVDAIEVGNGNVLIHGPRFDAAKATDTATSLAELSANRLSVVGGSDAHEAKEVGSVVTKFRRNVEAVGLGFLDAVRNRRTHPVFIDDKARGIANGPLCNWGFCADSFGDRYLAELPREQRLDYVYDEIR
jgi:hypothetical protein